MARSYNPLSGFIEDRGLKYVRETRAPGATDYQLAPTIWINTVTSDVYMQISATPSSPVWVMLTNAGGTMTDLAADVGTATPVAGVITIAGGTGIGTTAAGATLTVNLDVPVIVANGGTGAVTLTGVLTGNGTSAVTASPVTQYNVLVGGTSNAVGSVAPSATTGIALVSNGAAANPSFGTVVVAGGGTGATTLTDHGILLGSGTDAITATAEPSNGQLLIGSTGNDPVLATLTEGEAIDITNAAGSITIACEVATDSNLGVASFLAADFTIAAGAISLDDDILKALAGDTGIAAGSSHSITIAGGTGCSTVAAGSTVTVNVVGGGFDWTRIAGTTQAMAVQNGYIPTNVALTTCTLPATAALGDVIKIDGEGAGGWLVAQNAGQQIHFGVLSSTAGIGGNILSTNRRDCVTLRCTVASTEFIVENFVGNIGCT